LQVDDSSADTDLTSEVLACSGLPSHIHAVTDGLEAIALLREGKYYNALLLDFAILDLSLRNGGRAVEAGIKADPVLRKIPVAIFTRSKARQDVVRTNELSKTPQSERLHLRCDINWRVLIRFGAFAGRG
jgi:chemotaxis family two-component system response regulator Rcp1